ncbi:hypothetical protein [Colwellia sp. E150_009]
MFKKLAVILISFHLSACGLDVDRDKTEIPNMTGTWLSENTVTYTNKSDGQILKTTTKKIKTYIDDTNNGIKNVTCLQIWDGTADKDYDYSGTKTDNKYFPLGEDEPANSYLYKNGILLQEFEVDAIEEGLDAIKSIRKTLTYIDPTDTTYSDGAIDLSGSFEYSATTDICSQHMTQTLSGHDEINTYIFTSTMESSREYAEQGGIDIFFSFVGYPSPDLYNFENLETRFLGIEMWTYAQENIETFDKTRENIFYDPGWMDLISADKKSFEGNFSITRKDNSVITGYINVDVSDLH